MGVGDDDIMKEEEKELRAISDTDICAEATRTYSCRSNAEHSPNGRHWTYDGELGEVGNLMLHSKLAGRFLTSAAVAIY